MAEAKRNTAQVVRELVAPVADEMGYILWDVEFVKEGSRRYLRITIDHEDGIGIEDCERLHRAIDPILDEADPIEEQYWLEVSSPGLERDLKNDFQISFSIGADVEVKLYAPDEMGRKAFEGTLESYEDGIVTVRLDDGSLVSVKKSEAAKIKTVYDFN